MIRRAIGPVLLCVIVGCGGGGDGGQNDAPRADGPNGPDSDPNAPDADPNAPDADPTAPDAAPWETLISAQWTLPAGQEDYWCATVTLTEDVYAHVLRPIAPLGTHHTVIDIGPPSGPDNPGYSCGASFGEFWASGVGTPALTLPDGVGLLAAAGQQLKLSLHLFNASDGPMSGTSGLEVQRMDPSAVVHTASVSYHGPYLFSIPGNNTPYTATDTTGLGDRTLIAIFPHMHQLGTHFRARIVGGAGATLWDDAYQFESQEFAPLPSVPITSSQQLETQCTWQNDTGATVGWGDSSNAEMCFSILMSY